MCTRWWPVKKERNVESLRLKPTGLKTGKTLISYSLDHNAIWNPQFPSNTMTELSRVPICQESAGWNIQFPFFVVDIYWFCNWSNVFSYILGEKNILEYIFWNIYWNFSYILEFSIIYIVFVIGQFFFSQSLANNCTGIVHTWLQRFITTWQYKSCFNSLLETQKDHMNLQFRDPQTYVHMNRLRNSPHNITCSRYCLGQILNHTN